MLQNAFLMIGFDIAYGSKFVSVFLHYIVSYGLWSFGNCSTRTLQSSITNRRLYDSSIGCPRLNEWPSRSPSWSSSAWLARHRGIWQMTVGLRPTSPHPNSDRPTQRCASSDVQITVSATGVLPLLDHACGTRCQSIYGSATAVSDSLNGCWIPIRSVFWPRRFVTLS